MVLLRIRKVRGMDVEPAGMMSCAVWPEVSV